MAEAARQRGRIRALMPWGRHPDKPPSTNAAAPGAPPGRGARGALLSFARWLRDRIWRAIAWIGAGLVAFAVAGFLIAPLLLRPYLERQLSAAFDRTVRISRLDLNPFAVSATLHDVAIADRDEGPPLLTLPELYVNGEVASLFRWAPVISALKLTRPELNVIRNADKTYNFSDLLERALGGPPGPPPRFSISNIEVIDGRIVVDDRPERKRHEISELRIGIPFVSSLPRQVETRVVPAFSALINGQRVAVNGETLPFKDTHETLLHWDIDDLALPTYIDYVPFALPVTVASGRLDAAVDLRFVDHGGDPAEFTAAGTIKLADLVLNERSGSRLLKIPSAAVAIDALDFTKGSADVRSIAADGVELDVRRASGGELNLAALFPAKTPARGENAFRFRIGDIALQRGTVRIADASVVPQFDSTLTDITLDVRNLASTANQDASVAFSFLADSGARVNHRGTLGLAPLRAGGRLEIAGVRLAHLYPYYASALNLAVDDGTLDGAADVRFEGGADGALTLANLDATASSVKMRLPDEKEPLWQVPTLSVHGGSVDVAKRSIAFESIEGRGAAATVRRGADGNLNFERLIRRSEPGATASAGGETWRVEGRQLAFEDFAATFRDETVTPAARIALSRVSLKVENFSTAANARSRASLKAVVNKRGSVSLAGAVVPAPFAAKLDVVAKDVELVPFQAYLSRSARIVVTAGTASARGALDFAAGAQAKAGFKGDLVLRDVATLDEANDADLLKWKSLALNSVDAQLEPLAVSVGDIALDDFYARLLLNENGEFNLQQLARERAPASAPPTPAAEPKTVEVASPPGAATTWLKLGKATLTGGNVDFTDHFIRPNYSADLTGLAGSLSSLAFDQPADLQLRGSVQGSAPVQITGRINPLAANLFLDVKASATDIELPPLSPYSGKYVGYGITKGKLSMNVSYLVENRRLKAENGIVLDQLTFGDKVESPDAIKAPVLLAVALLKDRNGVIRFDLPVGGSLDDPQFSVGGLVFRALVNLILKAATAPFALLASLGGHGEELAYVEFAPGSAALDAAGEGKLKTIAKALVDRPAVKLDVAGRVDPAQDREALRRAALERQVRQQKFNDLVRSGEPPPSVDAVDVPAAEYEPLLTRAYKAADFPKPRNAIGLLKDLPREEMEALLLANSKIGDEDLRELADHRAQAVRTTLIDAEHVPAERVFVIAPRLDAQGVKDNGKTTRVDFALR